MEDTDKQALIEKLFIEKLDEEIAEIDSYDFGTFTVETKSGKAYFVGDERSCRLLAIQELQDTFDYIVDGDNLIKLLDKIYYHGVDDHMALDLVRELYDPENEMPQFDDFEYLYEFLEWAKLDLEDLIDYGLDADMIKPCLNFYEIIEFIVDEDGIENTLARYDGKEVWLGNGLYAYRVD